MIRKLVYNTKHQYHGFCHPESKLNFTLVEDFNKFYYCNFKHEIKIAQNPCTAATVNKSLTELTSLVSRAKPWREPFFSKLLRDEGMEGWKDTNKQSEGLGTSQR